MMLNNKILMTILLDIQTSCRTKWLYVKRMTQIHAWIIVMQYTLTGCGTISHYQTNYNGYWEYQWRECGLEMIDVVGYSSQTFWILLKFLVRLNG